MVGRQWDLGERLAGERDDADSVGPPRVDKAFHDFLRDLQPVVRQEVLREHRARDVDRDDDVDPFARHILRASGGTGPGEGDDPCGEREVAKEEEREGRGACWTCAAGKDRNAREDDRRRTAAAPQDPPERERQQE
jgi:hypothetical protein